MRLEKLTLPGEVFASMVSSAERASPREAVGLLGGREDGKVVREVTLDNLAPPGSFLADPYSQYSAFKDFRTRGLIPLAVYHSHPGGGAGLSDLDRRFARDLDLLQVVLALGRPWKPGVEVRAYRIDREAVEEVEVQLEGPCRRRSS